MLMPEEILQFHEELRLPAYAAWETSEQELQPSTAFVSGVTVGSVAEGTYEWGERQQRNQTAPSNVV